ncbi:Hypothetical protein PHPALM_20999 [Phytophthora palmivora]|uniref:Transmembrane protein n=1 Tax=Phytophthora palmivora TaxID=4796 RepID=A0A2P4XDH1_9STRA|nr:Hypothetical protein PHPALM_20999 [Phytophthora palmivora]
MTSSSKVYPTAIATPSSFLVLLETLERMLKAIGNYWKSIQVGHRGRYSVQRLLSFRDYYHCTSPGRVFLVCIMSLTPAFVVATLMECIPLKPPDAGWKANYAFWIRLFVSSLPVSFGAIFQVIEVLERGIISTTGIIVTGVGSCACYVALTLAIAAGWKFPVPFGYVFTVPPFVSFYMILLVLSIGPRVLARSPVLRQQLFSQLLGVAAQAVLAIAYPLFSAVFNQLSGNQQTAFIFVLPILKFCIKQVIAKTSAHLHECVGVIVVFSVDVCNVVYVVVCMQTATSPLTTTLMISSDAFFVILALRTIYYHSDASQARQKLKPMSNEALKCDFLEDLIILIRIAFQYASKHSAPSVPIRVRSPIPLPLSVESTQFIGKLIHANRRNAGDACSPCATTLTTSANSGPNILLFSSTERFQGSSKISRVVVSPSPSVSKVIHQPLDLHRIGPNQDNNNNRIFTPETRNAIERRNFASVVKTSNRKTTITQAGHSTAVEEAQDALQVLFHCEYVVMAEFIEFAIPMLYTIYLTILYRLPTAAYYPHTRSLTPEKFANTQVNLMMYASVELASFIGLNFLLKRKFGFSPVYQLAFVLETQVAILQGHYFLWISWILQITLEHNGVDLNAPFT